MREEQVIALTLLGLIVWNIAAYSVSLMTNSNGPTPRTGPKSSSAGNLFQQIAEAFKPFTCWTSSLYGIVSSSCAASRGNASKTGPQSSTVTASVWFPPVLILTFASYLNALWVLIGFTSLQLHRRRFEVEDSMVVAAVQAILPLATPILMLLQVFQDKLPTTKPQEQEAAIEA
jgi:hypothetical protein